MQRLATWIFIRLLILLRWKRRIIFANLRHCHFPNPETLYPRIIAHICREFVLVMANRNPFPQHITARAQSLLPELRRGGILLTAHYGNWEWMGPWLRSLGIPLVASYLPLKNPLANRILKFLRNRNGSYTEDFQGRIFRIRSLLQKGSLFTFLADQDFRGSPPIPPVFLFGAIRFLQSSSRATGADFSKFPHVLCVGGAKRRRRIGARLHKA
jgi:KDO2-lipid IV(A) lauroyltransferase